MYLDQENWHLGYSQLLSDCRGGKALLLCNADVDAMAAGRILSYMLRNDAISYQLVPCRTYSALESIVKDAVDVQAIVLLNLGASRNLTRLIDPERQITMFVLDCRRPVHLANVHASTDVVIFLDPTQSIDDIPSDGDNLSGNESEDEDSQGEEDSSDDETENEESDDDEEAEFGATDDNVEQQADDLSTDDPMTDAGNQQEAEYDGDVERDPVVNDPTSPLKEKRRQNEGDDDGNSVDEMSLTAVPTESTAPETPTQATAMTYQDLYQERQTKLRQYYSSGSYFGYPAAYTAYTIANQSRYRDISDLLWLACVGVTDAYLHARLDRAGFSLLATKLGDTVHRLFPDDDWNRVRSTVYAEDLVQGESNQRTKINFSKNGTILTEPDFRFFLLRHSSLHDSMIYSDYIATRLQVSTVAGKMRLQEMLAKMGFPLEECHQPYAFFKPSLRRQIPNKFREYAEEYGLTHLEFTSFFRFVGYQSLLTAADTSYAVTALLECDEDDKSMMDCFNTAFDALNSTQSSLVNGGKLTGDLGSGIRLAQHLQQKIFQTANNLMERRAITRLSHFRYAYITCRSGEGPQKDNSSSKDDHVFSKPLALTRLAHYIMDWHRENGGWKSKPSPLILLAEKPPSSYLVVGYEFPETAGALIRNSFGRKFLATAESMQGTLFRFDSFDSHVVEVDAAKVQRFLEQLHYLIDVQ